MRHLLLPVVLSLPLPAFAEDSWPSGATIDDAASLQVTPAGLSAMGDVVGAVLPESFDIPDQADGSDNGFCLISYEYEFRDGWAGLEMEDLRLVPRQDQLELQADLLVWINDATDTFTLNFEAACIGDNCPGYIDPFPVKVAAPISLDVTTDSQGNAVVDATIGNISVDNGLRGEHIHFQDGGCLSSVETFLQAAGISLYDFFIDQINPILVDLIQDYRSDIEAQIEEALLAARFEDQLDLNGVLVDVKLYPRDVVITPAGLEIIMAGKMGAEQAECMVDSGVAGSLKTATPIPAIANLPAQTQAVMHLSDDFANQALFALWNGGLLCYTLAEGSTDLELPIPLNTGLLDLLAPGVFTEIFPTTKPLIIQTDPRKSPLVAYDSDHDVLVKAHDLGVDMYGEIDGRMARAVGLTIDANVGIDLSFNATSGQMAVDVDLSGDAILATATHNEIVPAAKEQIEDGFNGLVGTLIPSLAGDALEGLAFSLPSANGVGLQSLDVRATGSEDDWMGAFVTLGPVTYGADGAGCGEGCQSEGESGCQAAGRGAVGLAVLLPLLALRRRRS